MAATTGNAKRDAIVQISISSKNRVMAQKIIDAIKGMPEFAEDDDVQLAEDTRRNPGSWGIRYAPFVFHTT